MVQGILRQTSLEVFISNHKPESSASGRSGGIKVQKLRGNQIYFSHCGP
jgi:hypothetical protein